MGDFFNIKLKINNREENIKIEKGVTFENNGAKYVVGSNGKLQKCDKKNNNIWTEAKEINLTEYQYSVFQSIADNDNKSGLSQEDIVTAFEQYRNSKFKEDIKKNLPEGYTIEATELKSSENWVSLDVKNGDSGAKLIFGIKDTDVSKSANNTKTESDNTNNSNTYTVQAGDSLGKIAEKFGISIKELMKINGIENPDTIYVGQVLKISQNENVEESNNKEVQTYTVQAGDSLGKIAEKFGIPIKELMKINGIENPDTIYVGQVLKISQNGNVEESNNKDAKTYTVQAGDTLGKIAERFGISIKELMKINGIENPDDIKVGQVLELPKNDKTKEINTTEKIELNDVTKKDTIGFLYSLRFQESTDNYKAKNGLGYVGAYQFGEQLMEDLGIYKPKKGSSKNSWQGIFKKNEYGITCLSDFLNSPDKQDKLMQAALDLNWKYITIKKLDKYLGQTINGVKITKSGLLAGAHLVGVGGLEKFLRNNNDVTDGNGVHVSEYLRKFGGFDVELSS